LYNSTWGLSILFLKTLVLGLDVIVKGDVKGKLVQKLHNFLTAALKCPTQESEDKDWKGRVIDFPKISYTTQWFSLAPLQNLFQI